MRIPTRSMIFLAFSLTTPLSWAQRVATDELMSAPAETVGMASAKLARIRPVLQQLVDRQRIPGAIVVVARRGKVVLSETVGWRDVQARDPLQHDSILRFYSMTKPLTSVAAMMLVEQGQLELDVPVEKYVPEFEGLRVWVEPEGNRALQEDVHRPMTIRDLLRHTSGLTYGFFGSTAVDQQYRESGVLAPQDTAKEMIQKLSKIPLMYQPGTRFNYSVSTDVLGHVVERVSGMRLGAFLRQRVFDPLDMRDTGFHVPPDKVDRFANNYGPESGGDGLKVIDAVPTSPYLRPPAYDSGGGGTVSTARDYLRFCQMLLEGGQLQGKRLLTAESVRLMTENQLPKAAYPVTLNGRRDGVGFGLGFSVVVEKTDHTRDAHLGEYGWGGAASTHFWISPRDELAVVALTQYMPFSFLLEETVKPLVYDAILP